ncbi:C-C motif chemokine 20b [Nelusetta ayraudi]|uniref:C-C motif chemokine 20b n=1 Tax=Nelusetta ayraudi TaxID=303726 RepID=UPI003F73123E
MTNGRLCLVALCSLLILCTFISSSQSVSCCLRYTPHPPPCHRIRTFSVQTIGASCDINAIIFHRKNNRLVCADPKSTETLERLGCLKRRRQTQMAKKQKTQH